MTKQYLQKDLYIGAIEFGLRHPDGFTYKEIFNDNIFVLTDSGKDIISKHLYNAYSNAQNADVRGTSANIETLFQIIHRGGDWQDNNSQYTISLDPYFKYLEYKELRFARTNAREARLLSRNAIRFSIIAIIVSAVTPIVVAWCVTQTVKIEKGQLEVLKTAIAPPD